ncbi:MAG: nickel/cobalt transporter [Hyphomicrobiales bacterium]
MRAILAIVVLTLFCGVATAQVPAPQGTAAAAAAEQPFDQRKLLVPRKNADGTVAVVPFTDDPVLWARTQQQNFHARMTAALKAVGGGGQRRLRPDAHQPLSFLYGVLHAAGPGHGKAVISGWLLATETQLRRGIIVAFLSAVFQALTAIVVVSLLLLLAAGAASAVKDAQRWLDGASFAMIAALGAYLMWTGLKRFLPVATPKLSAVAAAPASDTPYFEIVTPLPASIAHDHVHGPDCGCGHAHAPEPADVAGDFSWRRAVALAFAVGLRPCTGALLVLVFSYNLGLYWAGVLSTFAMAFGTFLTISVVATIAVYGKSLAERLAARDGRWMGWLSTGLRLGAGGAILLFGAVMFVAALQGPLTSG